MLWVYGLEIFQFFQCGDRLYTPESDVSIRQILTYGDGPRTEKVNVCMMSTQGLKLNIINSYHTNRPNSQMT